jgi:hypothetical protein
MGRPKENPEIDVSGNLAHVRYCLVSLDYAFNWDIGRSEDRLVTSRMWFAAFGELSEECSVKLIYDQRVEYNVRDHLSQSQRHMDVGPCVMRVLAAVPLAR